MAPGDLGRNKLCLVVLVQLKASREKRTCPVKAMVFVVELKGS